MTPPVGPCQGCRQQRPLHQHRSRHDGLPRLVCIRCHDAVVLAEERGERMDWAAGRGHGEELVGFLDGGQ
jgi:hypothetical protein